MEINLYDCYSTIYPYLQEDTFGERLRKVRKRKFMLQHELSEKIGYKYMYICNIENGQVYPSANIIKKLYKIFGQDVLVDSYSKFICSDFANSIRSWRKEKGFTQIQAGKYLGIGSITVSNLEREQSMKKFVFDKIEDKLKEELGLP